jgi:tetratricopeptide (TPR) repeat protein
MEGLLEIPWRSFIRLMFNETKNALIFKTHARDKNILKDYERVLEFLNKDDVIEPNITHTLTRYIYVQMVLKDRERALEDLDKVHFLKPNNAFILMIRGDVKRMLDDYQ